MSITVGGHQRVSRGGTAGQWGKEEARLCGDGDTAPPGVDYKSVHLKPHNVIIQCYFH